MVALKAVIVTNPRSFVFLLLLGIPDKPICVKLSHLSVGKSDIY